MSLYRFRRFSTFLLNNTKSYPKNPIEQDPVNKDYPKNAILLPHRTMPLAKAQDGDFVSIVYSYLIHSEWDKLGSLTPGLTPFRIKHVLLKTKKDYVLSLEFFKWAELQNPELITPDVHSIILHILAKHRKFISLESILKKVLGVGLSKLDFPLNFFEALVYSYRMCESSPLVFDALFRTYVHMKKLRNASDTFCWMRQYGFYPTIKSCNRYLCVLNSMNHGDIALAFYKEMRRCKISPNVYTFNMVIGAFCKLGKLEMAVDVFKEMKKKGFTHSVVSYNTLIYGFCSKGLFSWCLKFKSEMEKNGVFPNDVTYNTLINAFCRDGNFHEANKLFSEMKRKGVNPTLITYNTLLRSYGKAGNSDMGRQLLDEMSVAGIKCDVLTYNAVILGLCREGKTKKAANMVKVLDKEKLVPNSSTFSALIMGQCVRNNSERAFQIYEIMVRSGCHPDKQTLELLLSTFMKNEDYKGAVLALKAMTDRAVIPESGLLSYLSEKLYQCGKQELAMNLCKELFGLMTMRLLEDRDINSAEAIHEMPC